MQWSKQVVLFNHEDCERLRLPGAPEDLVMFQGKAISGIDDRLSLWEHQGPANTPDGRLVSIDVEQRTYELIDIDGFPKDIAFHPLGLKLL